MPSRSIPSVTLYIRITDEKGNRRYERVNRRKPQLKGRRLLPPLLHS